MIATNNYRIIKVDHDDTRERNARCDGYERKAHRASFVYIFGSQVLCLFCYLNALDDSGKKFGDAI